MDNLLMVENVMGVEGLEMCTGSPTKLNPEGIFWSFHGISLTKEEALKKLKRKATKMLDINDEAESFLAQYINDYNESIGGYGYY